MILEERFALPNFGEERCPTRNEIDVTSLLPVQPHEVANDCLTLRTSISQ